MIRHLFVKDLREHVLSLRFQVGFALALVLIATSAFVLSSGYTHAMSDYHQRLNEQDAFFSRYAHINRLGAVGEVTRPPSEMVLVRGLPEDIGWESLDANPMRELFPPMDLGIIVAVIMSLLGIVLGFDALNGEREEGTLRLILANSVPRASVIVAKWAAGMTVLGVAFLSAFLFGLLIVLLRAGVAWQGREWISLAGVAVVSLLYTGAFFTLALAFSVLFTRSSASVLASLLAWVVFVLVVPNISPYVAAQVVRLPAVAALERERQYLTSEKRDEIGRQRTTGLVEKHGLTREALQPAAVKARSAADPDFARRYKAYREESDNIWRQVNVEQRAASDRLMQDWTARSKAQLGLSRTLAYASPLPPLLFALTDLSATGFQSLEAFQEQRSAFGTAFFGYANQRAAEERKRNPAHGVNDFIDLTGRPRFTYAAPRWQDRFDLAARQAAVLFGWMAVFFAAAVALFLRFDVR